MPYIGKTECHQCEREVDAHVNVSGMGYYNCGPCGFRAQQKTERGNRMFMERVRRDPDPDAVTKGADTGEETPAISRESQNPKPAASEAKKRAGGLLNNSIFGGTRR
ncbi:hypothetical protein WI80_33355 [Burkholderia ubonensis]|uniref:hypothetical protein n=1 Tax=Burkholderia ubonensis TaxID=101571 RepID=UPI000756E1C0|nr:hypothetical protein [Burkholderia ubonensis]KVD19184.1 hypothetical protein WI80_33355 [Burkholderia ubonensis]KVU12663.1 hypothetical protein WK63_19385 [Burkholderia ubonensis]